MRSIVFVYLVLSCLGNALNAQKKFDCNLELIKSGNSKVAKSKFINQTGLVIERELVNRPEIIKILTKENKDTTFLDISFFVRTENKLIPGSMVSNFNDSPQLEQFLYETISTNFRFNEVLNECNEPLPQPSPVLHLIFTKKHVKEGSFTLAYGGIDRNVKSRVKSIPQKLAQTPLVFRCKERDNIKQNKKCISREFKIYISKNLSKDVIDQLRQKSCRQICYASFVLNKQGHVDKIKVVSSSLLLGAEVGRLLKEVRAKKSATNKNGKPISINFSLPVILKFR